MMSSPRLLAAWGSHLRGLNQQSQKLLSQRGLLGFFYGNGLALGVSDMVFLAKLKHPFQIAGQFWGCITGDQAEQGGRVGVFQPCLEGPVVAQAIDRN